MNWDEWFDLTYQTNTLLKAIALLPDSPSKRSLHIQAHKLYRLLTAKDAQVKVLGGGSLKKIRKRIGQRAATIGHQARVVRELTDKYFKEILRQGNPRLTNAEYREWKAKFDSAMTESTKQVRLVVTQKVENTLKAQPPIKTPELH